MTALRLSAGHAWEIDVAANLGAPVEDLAVTLASDHIRAIAAATLSQPSSSYKAAHSARMSAAVRRNVAPWLPFRLDGPDDALSLIRTNLAHVGDLYSAGDGYWLPGPTRLISVPGESVGLLISGKPWTLLEPIQRYNRVSYATSRWLNCNAAQNLGIDPENFADWMGGFGLQAWRQDLERRVANESRQEVELDADAVEIYAPEYFSSQRRLGFWADAKELALDRSLRLFRPKVKVGFEFTRRYYLGTFQNRTGAPTLSKSVLIDGDDAARYRFAVDASWRLPRRVDLLVSTANAQLSLKMRLPDPERRVLSLGWPAQADTDVLRFCSEAIPFLKAAFNRLGITVQEKFV